MWSCVRPLSRTLTATPPSTLEGRLAKCCGKLPADAANMCATLLLPLFGGGRVVRRGHVGHSSLSSTSCHIRRIPGNLKLPEPPVGIRLVLLASCLLPLAHLWLASPSLSLSRSRFLPPSSCYFILISSLLYGANIKSSELLSRFIDIIWMGRHLV